MHHLRQSSIEKEERRLHIIDPFFAFFLRWGAPQLQDEMLRQRN